MSVGERHAAPLLICTSFYRDLSSWVCWPSPGAPPWVDLLGLGQGEEKRGLIPLPRLIGLLAFVHHYIPG
jgi:hypothetical protein